MLTWWNLRKLRSDDPDTRVDGARRLGRSGKPAAVEPLVVAALLDPSEWVREAAAQAIAALGRPEALQMLVATAVQAPVDPQVLDHLVWAAARALHTVRDPGAIHGIIAAMLAADAAVRSRGARIWSALQACDREWLLGCARPMQAEVVQRISGEPDPAIRLAAVDLLAEIADPAARPVFLAFLADPAETVRAAAVRAVAPMLPLSDAGPLLALLADPSDRVREITARSALLRSPGATPLLTARLEIEPVELVRFALIEALISVGGAETERGLVIELARFGRAGRHALAALKARGWEPRSPAERAFVIVQGRALGPVLSNELVAIGSAAVGALVSVLQSGVPHDMAPSLYAHYVADVLRVMARIGDRSALPAVQAVYGRATEAFDAVARAAAIEATIALGGVDAVEQFLTADGLLEAAVVKGIEALGPRAIPTLVGILGVHNGLAAAAALGRLGWKPTTEEERARHLVATGCFTEAAELGASAAAPLIGAILERAGQVTYAECEGQTGVTISTASVGYAPALALQQVLERALATIDSGVIQRAARLESFSFQFTAVGNCGYATTMNQGVDLAPVRQLARQELLRRGIEA